jgi:hypothetical protein
MARIKITGYLDTLNLEPQQVDEADPTGLSSDGYLEICNDLGLEDIDFELEA